VTCDIKREPNARSAGQVAPDAKPKYEAYLFAQHMDRTMAAFITCHAGRFALGKNENGNGVSINNNGASICKDTMAATLVANRHNGLTSLFGYRRFSTWTKIHSNMFPD